MTNTLLSNTPRTVVVADDDPAWRLLVRLLLEPRGFHLAEARDGVEALHAVQSLAPDVLVLDLTMPRLNGWEVCQRLRACASHPQPAIIVMTSADDLSALAAGSAMAVDRVLSKPFDPMDLLEAVEKLIASRGHAPAVKTVPAGSSVTASAATG